MKTAALSALLSLLCCLCSCVSPAPESPPSPTNLFPEAGELLGWRTLGMADFTAATAPGEGSILTGHGEGLARNSFLVSEAQYGDFELLADVRIDAGGNSGIQIRSHVDWDADGGNGKLWGYQVEIDPSERGWSAGLYDEGRRGWLAQLVDNEEARSSFVVGEWNEYRILCEGPRIRTWINGIVAVDFVDEGEDMDLVGHLAFQVHGGGRTHVAWRNARIKLLPAEQ